MYFCSQILRDMKQIFRIYGVCALLLGGVAFANAALPGTTCSSAIPLTSDFRETITGPKTVWYSAWTFDLPLTVYFAPKNESDPAPIVEMDFSCTSGVYTDSILCSLFCKTGSSSGVVMDMPHKPALQTDRLQDGTFVYYLSLGKKYRDLLLQMGISYNLEVYVKVVYNSAGVISIAPNDLFSNCMDGHKFIHLGDTVQVKPRDKERHVIVPYVQWQDDSIRYVWEGTEDVVAAVGYACTYDPESAAEEILDKPILHAPKDTLKMTSADLKYYVKNADSEAGMFYAKFFTNGKGTMKIERVPQAPPQGGATLLRYDRTTPVDTAKLYAIPYTWTTATLFKTPTDHIFRMYVGKTHDFQKSNAIATYQFSPSDAGHWLGLLADDMQALWTQAVSQYLYIRFETTALKTTITPTEWQMSECMTKATPIYRPSTTIDVEKGSYGAAYYRFYYREWAGGDMTFKWLSNSSTCPTFIGDNCTFTANKYDEHVIKNQTIAKKGTWTLSAADVAKWESKVDEDGYLYIRFNPGSAGQMVISTTAPEEEDPAPILYPTATISVVCDGEPTATGQPYIIRVSAEQDLSIYVGDPADIASRTPIETWHQTTGTNHTVVLKSGVYTLKGADETIRVEVK